MGREETLIVVASTLALLLRDTVVPWITSMVPIRVSEFVRSSTVLALPLAGEEASLVVELLLADPDEEEPKAGLPSAIVARRVFEPSRIFRLPPFSKAVFAFRAAFLAVSV